MLEIVQYTHNTSYSAHRSRLRKAGLLVETATGLHTLLPWRTSCRTVFLATAEHTGTQPLIIKMMWKNEDLPNQNDKEVETYRKLPSKYRALVPALYDSGVIVETVREEDKSRPVELTNGSMIQDTPCFFNYVVQEYLELDVDAQPQPHHYIAVSDFSMDLGLLDLTRRGPDSSATGYNWGLTKDNQLKILDYAV